MDITPAQCLEVRAALPLYVGADLDPEEMETVGAHLARCAPCDGLHRSALASRAVLLEGLRTTGSRPVPSIWEGIRGQLVSEVPALPRRVDTPVLRPQVARWGLHRTGIGAAAAAAAIVLCFGFAQLTQPDSGGAPGTHLSRAVAPALVSSLVTGSDAAPMGATPVRPAEDLGATNATGLVRVGPTDTPLYPNAVEVRFDQGTFPARIAPQRADHGLVGGSPQLTRDRR